MCLKIGEYLNIQVSYDQSCPKHSHFLDFQFAFRGGCFLAVFMKNMGEPLGVTGIDKWLGIDMFTLKGVIVYCLYVAKVISEVIKDGHSQMYYLEDSSSPGPWDLCIKCQRTRP